MLSRSKHHQKAVDSDQLSMTDEGGAAKPGLPRRAWRRIKGLSRKTPCVKHSAANEDQDVEVAGDKQHEMNGNVGNRHSISKISTASSNRSYYTANDMSELDSRMSSNRFDSDSLAELDAYGAEVEEQRRRLKPQHLGSGKRGGSMKLKGDLPAVPEGEARLRQNGDANEGQEGEAYPSGERGDFLRAYDAAVLEMLNRLSSSQASCIGDIPLLDVAPWNRRPGYLVSPTCNIRISDFILHIYQRRDPHPLPTRSTAF